MAAPVYKLTCKPQHLLGQEHSSFHVAFRGCERGGNVLHGGLLSMLDANPTILPDISDAMSLARAQMATNSAELDVALSVPSTRSKSMMSFSAMPMNLCRAPIVRVVASCALLVNNVATGLGEK